MALKSRRLHKNGDKKKIPESVQKSIAKPKEKMVFAQEKGFAIFAIGSEWYCIDLDSIYEILHDYEITAVSHLPDFFEGITNLREESIPVVNLRQLLDLNPGNQTFPVCIISESNGAKTGFLVDSEIEIVKVSDVQVFALPDCYSPEEQKFLEGIIEHKNKLIGILKLNQVLNTLTEWRSKNEDK